MEICIEFFEELLNGQVEREVEYSNQNRRK